MKHVFGLILCLLGATNGFSPRTWLPVRSVEVKELHAPINLYNCRKFTAGDVIHLGGQSCEQPLRGISEASDEQAEIVLIRAVLTDSNTSSQTNVSGWRFRIQYQHGGQLDDVVFNGGTSVVVPPYGSPQFVLARCEGACAAYEVVVATLAPQANDGAPCEVVVNATIADKVPSQGMHTVRRFLAASRSSSEGEVTICVQLTMERLYKLDRLAGSWNGSISASVFIREPERDLAYLVEWWTTSPACNQRVDVHVVFDDKRTPFDVPPNASPTHLAYPINYMRNVAIQAARTTWVLLVEGDMTVPSGSFSTVQAHVKRTFAPALGTAVGFILPTFFNSADYSEGQDLPRTKVDLQSSSFVYCPYASHKFLDLPAWFATPEESDALPVRLGQMEPYFIVERALYPLFDESYFCVGDKVQQVSVARTCAHFTFAILPDLFLMNIEHYEQAAVRDERIFPEPQLCGWFLRSHLLPMVRRGSDHHKQWSFGQLRPVTLPLLQEEPEQEACVCPPVECTCYPLPCTCDACPDCVCTGEACPACPVCPSCVLTSSVQWNTYGNGALHGALVVLLSQFMWRFFRGQLGQQKNVLV